MRALTEMLPHQARVVKELNDLSEKIEGLNAFIRFSSSFHALSDVERGLLCEQLKVMGHYASVLNSRLEYWGVV